MTIVNAVLGGIGAALISYGAVLALAAKNRDSLKTDAEQVSAIDEGGAADAEWVEKFAMVHIRARLPSVASAVSSTCGFSEQDIADIDRSYKFWGGNEAGCLDTGCSDWLLATCLLGGTAAGAIGGATEGVLFGCWVATFIGICVNDFRYRRIDLASIALLALLGVFMGGHAGITSKAHPRSRPDRSPLSRLPWEPSSSAAVRPLASVTYCCSARSALPLSTAPRPYPPHAWFY